jgi:putative drug exporter of the RND superfamily
MASWVLRHRRLVIGTWCLLFAVTAPFAWRVQDVLKGASDGIPGSQSVETIARAVDGGIPAGTFFPFLVLLKSDGIPVDDLRFQAAAQDIERRLGGVPQGGAVRSFWNTGRADLLGRDRQTALMLFRTNAASLNEAEALTPEVRVAVNGASLPVGFRVLVTGTAPMFFDLGRQSSADLLRAERVGLPVTLIILLVAFGAPLAAGLPVLLALLAVTVSSAALFVLSQITTVSVFSQNVVSMIGLGVGVDYALFIVSSFRNALAQGLSGRESAARAVSGAGHTIVVSGLAVAIGFCALFLVNVPFLRSMAAGGIFVVVTAVAASLTILPIALSYAGTTVNWPRTQQKAPPDGTGVWGRWAGLVMRRPWRFLIAGLAILAVFVAPVLRLQAWNVGVESLIPELEARAGYDVLIDEFEQGAIGPTILVVEAPLGSTVWAPEFQRGVLTLSERLSQDPRVASINGFPDLLSVANTLHRDVRSSADLPDSLRPVARDLVSEGDRMALLVLLPSFAPESRESMALVDDLRRDAWRELEGLGVRVGISGTTALTKDFDDEIFSRMKIVVPVVLGVTFTVLLVSFRSVLIPLKAILLNLLSVLASYGFLIYVFQDGVGAQSIGLSPPGGLNSFIVLVLFTILFGLSMDYHVFLLDRVKEAYATTGDTVRAVSLGLQQTAGLISSAALVMVSIFGSFAFTRLVATRELGLGLAFAVTLDATLVRMVLVPALMTLLGSYNWWVPLYSGRERSRPRPLCDDAVESRAGGRCGPVISGG